MIYKEKCKPPTSFSYKRPHLISLYLFFLHQQKRVNQIEDITLSYHSMEVLGEKVVHMVIDAIMPDIISFIKANPNVSDASVLSDYLKDRDHLDAPKTGVDAKKGATPVSLSKEDQCLFIGSDKKQCTDHRVDDTPFCGMCTNKKDYENQYTKLHKEGRIDDEGKLIVPSKVPFKPNPVTLSNGVSKAPIKITSLKPSVIIKPAPSTTTTKPLVQIGVKSVTPTPIVTKTPIIKPPVVVAPPAKPVVAPPAVSVKPVAVKTPVIKTAVIKAPVVKAPPPKPEISMFPLEGAENQYVESLNNFVLTGEAPAYTVLGVYDYEDSGMRSLTDAEKEIVNERGYVLEEEEESTDQTPNEQEEGEQEANDEATPIEEDQQDKTEDEQAEDEQTEEMAVDEEMTKDPPAKVALPSIPPKGQVRPGTFKPVVTVKPVITMKPLNVAVPAAKVPPRFTSKAIA